jgi:PAS domain S-box-containing protein
MKDTPSPRESLRHLAKLVMHMPGAMLGTDRDGLVLVFNAQAGAIFGRTPEELLGRRLEALVPGCLAAMRPLLSVEGSPDACAPPIPATVQLRAHRKDGSEFPVEIRLSGTETERGPLAIALVHDISERQRAQRKFEEFVELAPDAIVGVDRDGRIVLVNAQTEMLFDRARDALIGQPVELLVPERFRAADPADRDAQDADRRVRPLGGDRALFGRRSDGSEFPAEISLSNVETEEGPLAVASIRDISDRVAAAQERAELEAELHQARRVKVEGEKRGLEEQLDQMRRLESVGQLAGGIAHDFNNLLAVILNYADFVAEEIGEDSPAFEDVGEILHAAQRGAALTRQLLIFSRRDVVRPKVLDLNQLLAEVTKLLDRSLGEHVRLDTRPATGLWPVEADAGQLDQVLVNLAVNARDAMPDGGDLVIETRNVEADGVFCELHGLPAAGRYVQLVVSDTGSGMEPDVISHAFEPFFTTKAEGEGTGLGLSTVYGIVTDAGGIIELRSEPGAGTTVTTYLPASDGHPRLQETPRDARPPARGEAVLVVEDEDAVRRLTQRILQSAGYRVTATPTADAALGLCAEDTAIDLLLTDVIMPEMLGPELVERAVALRPALRVLYMSGYTNQPVVRRQVAESDAAFVEKPFTAQTLLAAVRETLDVPLLQEVPSDA